MSGGLARRGAGSRRPGHKRAGLRGLSPQARGFTLVELMLCLVVAGVLAAVAYPQYTQQMQRGRRAQAQASLMAAAQLLQRAYVARGAYTGVELPAADPASQSHRLTLEVGEAGQSYRLSAVPQQADALCGTLHLADTGAKSQSGPGRVVDCW